MKRFLLPFRYPLLGFYHALLGAILFGFLGYLIDTASLDWAIGGAFVGFALGYLYAWGNDDYKR